MAGWWCAFWLGVALRTLGISSRGPQRAACRLSVPGQCLGTRHYSGFQACSKMTSRTRWLSSGSRVHNHLLKIQFCGGAVSRSCFRGARFALGGWIFIFSDTNGANEGPYARNDWRFFAGRGCHSGLSRCNGIIVATYCDFGVGIGSFPLVVLACKYLTIFK